MEHSKEKAAVGSSLIQKHVMNKISALLCEEKLMSDEERVDFLSHFSDEFKKSWQDILRIYNDSVVPNREAECDMERKDENAEEKEQISEKLEEELEEAAIHYEAMLLATCKHRVNVSSLSKQLEKTYQLKIAASEKKKVDLPLKVPLDLPSDPTLNNEEDHLQQLKRCREELSAAISAREKTRERMSNLSTAMTLVMENGME